MYFVFWFIEFNVQFRICSASLPPSLTLHCIWLRFCFIYSFFSCFYSLGLPPSALHSQFVIYLCSFRCCFFSSPFYSKLTWSSCSISQFKDKQIQQTNYLYACGYILLWFLQWQWQSQWHWIALKVFWCVLLNVHCILYIVRGDVHRTHCANALGCYFHMLRDFDDDATLPMTMVMMTMTTTTAKTMMIMMERK